MFCCSSLEVQDAREATSEVVHFVYPFDEDRNRSGALESFNAVFSLPVKRRARTHEVCYRSNIGSQ